MKNFAIIAIASLLTLTLTACGGDGSLEEQVTGTWSGQTAMGEQLAMSYDGEGTLQIQMGSPESETLEADVSEEGGVLVFTSPEGKSGTFAVQLESEDRVLVGYTEEEGASGADALAFGRIGELTRVGDGF